MPIKWELRFSLYLLLLVFSFEARKVPESHIVFPISGEKLKPNKTESVTEITKEIPTHLPETESRINLLPETTRNETTLVMKTETTSQQEEPTGRPQNVTVKLSEEKMIVFKQSEEEDETNKLWNQNVLSTTERKNLDIGPRITLETLPRCKEGFKLVGEHCRREA